MFRELLIVVALVVFGSGAIAQDQEKPAQPEKLPAPKVVEQPPVFIDPILLRPAPRDVWQHYGVSSLGRFVPRVISTPYGYYYSRDMEPYHWPQTRSTSILP